MGRTRTKIRTESVKNPEDWTRTASSALAVKMVQVVDSRLNRRIWVERSLKDMEHAATPSATLWVFPGDAEWLPVQVLQVEVSEMWKNGKNLCVECEVMGGVKL